MEVKIEMYTNYIPIISNYMEYWVWETSSLTPDAPRTPCGRWRCRSSASGESKELLGDREEWEWTVEIWKFPGKIINEHIYFICDHIMYIYIYIGVSQKCGTPPSRGHLTGTMIINQRIS